MSRKVLSRKVLSRKRGLMGGTFDPIHLGHLLAAGVAREAAGLDNILFMPAGKPPHKQESSITAAEHRFQMVAAAISGTPWFTVSDMETTREGATYTVDTLERLVRMEPETIWYYIIGADVVCDLENWRQIERVSGMCRFLALQRSGFPMRRIRETMRLLKDRYGMDITLISAPRIDISSSEIRNREARGLPIRYMVPEAVERYIHEHGLYKKR